MNESQRVYNLTHKDEIKKRKREWFRKHYHANTNGFRDKVLQRAMKFRDRYNIQQKRFRDKYKIQALTLVGRGKLQCSRCEEQNIIVLQIHHRNGDPTKEHNRSDYVRRRIISGERTVEDLQLLCANCHLIVDYERRNAKSI